MRRLIYALLISVAAAALLGTGYGPGGAGTGGGGGGSGDVTGPVSSTDDAIAVWNGTGGATLQDSACTILTGDLDCAGDLSGSALTATPTAGTPGSVVINEDPDDGANTLTIAISGSGLPANQTCTVDSNGSSGSTCPFATNDIDLAIISFAENDADDYVTGLELGNYDDICTGANTPFNCCQAGTGVGACDGLEAIIGSAITVAENAYGVAHDTVSLAETGTYEFTVSAGAGFTATTGNECIAFELAVDSGTATVSEINAVVGSGARASSQPFRGGSTLGAGYVVVTGAPAVMGLYAKSCGTGTGYDGVFPTTNIIGDLDSNSPGFTASVLRIRKLK